MATGRYLDDAALSAILLSALDPSNDFFAVWDDSAGEIKRVASSQILNRLTSTADVSHLSALANLAAIDSANDKFLVWDASATAFKTLTATEILDRILTTADISSLSGLTTVEGVDPTNDRFIVWDSSASAMVALTASQVVSKLWQGPKVAITSTPQSPAASASGTLYHNTGSTVAITVNLPAATAGLRFSFARVAAYNITLDGNSSETINGALTYTLSTAGRVDIECFSAGTWVVTSSTSSRTRTFNVRDYGAAGDGSTDDTAAFDAAIAAAGADDVVEIPAGDYALGPLATVTATGGITFRGAGRYATILRFVPTADNQSLFDINRTGSSPTSGVTFEGFTIRTTDTTYSKTAIKLTDGSETRFNNVAIDGWLGNTDSVGLWTLGRESLWATDLFIEATVPIRIGVNPNTADGYLSADHFTFNNCYLNIPSGNIPSSLVSAICLVDSGLHVSQLQFTGSQAWVGGRYGLYWVDTADVAPYCSSIRLENVRTEQGVTPASYYSVYIAVNDGTGVSANKYLKNFSAANCEFESSRNGMYLRNVWNVHLDNCLLEQASTLVAVDIADAFMMDWTAVKTSSSAGASTITTDSNLMLNRAAAHVNGFPYPSTATWTRRSTAANYAERPTREMSAHKWYWSGSLADDATVQLPCNADTNSWLHAKICAIATIAASNVIEYGEWYAAPVTGLTNGIVKLAGSANTSAGDVDTDLCVFSDGASPMYAGVYVKNRLGGTANVTIEVIGKRSVET